MKPGADQLERRGLERSIKKGALVLARASRQSLPQTAQALGLRPATLRGWRRHWRCSRLGLRRRGRPRKIMPPLIEQYLLTLSDEPYQQIELAALSRVCPEASRRSLQEWLREHRRKQLLQQSYLEWRGPGGVWAMDFTFAPWPIESRYPYVLAVRDLASGYTLLAQPSESMAHVVVEAALRALFQQHGAPLVLKHDGGFQGLELQTLLDVRQVTPLLSPPYTPRYNGSIEAGIGALKTRAHEQATSQGRPEYWTCDDLEAARCQANQSLARSGPTPETRWEQRSPLTIEVRAGFTELVRHTLVSIRKEHQWPIESAVDLRLEASARRLAVRRALEAHGLLQVHRGRLTPPLITPVS